MTRILLVDDHPLFLDGVRAALTGATDLEVVGEAHDGATGIALAAELEPDVVLMDLNLPDLSGVDAAGRILAAAPDVRVLMMTMSTDDDAVVAAMRVGARGYVVKGAGRDDLLHAIRTVAAGGAVFSPTVADRLGRFFTGMATGAAREVFPQLTGREMEVPASCTCRTRPCATTCRTCSPSSASRIAPRLSPGHVRRASGTDYGRTIRISQAPSPA
jgi:DNA-binding NarL/FixJ family response regulator